MTDETQTPEPEAQKPRKLTVEEKRQMKSTKARCITESVPLP